MKILRWTDDLEKADVTIDHWFNEPKSIGVINKIIILSKVVTGKATVLLDCEKHLKLDDT